MKATYTLLMILVGFPVVGIGSTAAGDPSYQAILSERGRVLAEIVHQLEARRALGTVTEGKVREARIARLEFERDTAETKSDRVRFQSEIVRERTDAVKALHDGGKAIPRDTLDTLYAEEQLLAARQRLEEIKAAAGN